MVLVRVDVSLTHTEPAAQCDEGFWGALRMHLEPFIKGSSDVIDVIYRKLYV